MLGLAFLIVIARLLWLYVSEGIINTNYKDPEITGEYYRGTIYDRNNEILAMDSIEYLIKINTKSLTGISKAASLLAPYTQLSALEIEGLLAQEKAQVTLESNLSSSSLDEFATLIEKERLDRAIKVEKVLKRAYPTNDHGKNMIGRVDGRLNGTSGAELYFNETLEPPLILEDGVIKGEDIRLSMDIEIQYICDFVLSYFVESETGMVSVLGKNDGQLYALSSNGYEWQEILEIIRYPISPSFVPSMLAAEKSDMQAYDGATHPFNASGYEAYVLESANYVIIAASENSDTSRGIAQETMEVMIQRGKIRTIDL